MYNIDNMPSKETPKLEETTETPDGATPSGGTKRKRKAAVGLEKVDYDYSKGEAPTVTSHDVLSPKAKKEYQRVSKEAKVLRSKREAKKDEDKTAALKGVRDILADTDKAIENSYNHVRDWPAIDEIAELFEKGKISQVVVHAKEDLEPEVGENGETPGLTFAPDHDSRLALYLLNDFNKKTGGKMYSNGAKSSLIIKGGNEKNLQGKHTGLIVFIDVGGRWLEIQDEKGKKTKYVFIDHHGSQKGIQTSSAEMMYEILRRAGLLKENRKWMENLVKTVTDNDNLLYLGEKDAEGKKVFNSKHFREVWPRSLRGMAGEIPFNVLLDLFKSGKIKDPSKVFTEEELEGELGKISWPENWNKKNPDGTIEKRTVKTIADLCEIRKGEAKFASYAIINDIRNGREKKLNLENTRIGRGVYHNFHKIKQGKKWVPNTIPFKIAYIAARAYGYDALIVWNKKKPDRRFFINSKHPALNAVGDDINKVAPGTKVVRAAMLFPPKNAAATEGLTQKAWLDTIDPTIAENALDLEIDEAEENEAEAKELQELEERRMTILKKIEEVEKEIAKLEAEINALPEDEEEKEEEETPEEELVSDAEIVEAEKEYTDQFIKREIYKLLQKAGSLKKINELEVKGKGQEMFLETQVTAYRDEKKKSTVDVKIKATLENSDGGVKIKNYSIDAGFLARVFAQKEVESKILPHLENISSILKEYIQTEEKREVEKIEIEDGKLKVIFKD